MNLLLGLLMTMGAIASSDAQGSFVGQDSEGNLVLTSADGADVFVNGIPIAATLQGMPQDLAATIVSMLARIDAQDRIIAAQAFSTPAPTLAPTTSAPTSNTAAPTTEPPTGAPTRVDIASGNIIISQLHHPAALCTGGDEDNPIGCSTLTAEQEAAIVQVTGGVYIEYAAVTTLAGRLPLLERVGGTFRIHNNPRLAALDAFGSLRSIGGDLVISTNPELLVINGSAFGALENVGRRFALTGHSQLHTVASSAFGALETVGDYFLVQQIHQITDLGDGVFGALRSVGGYFMLHDNDRLNSITGSAFGSLETVGGNFHLSANRQFEGIANSAFGSLRTIAGYFRMNLERLRAITGSAFGSLDTVGGDFTVAHCGRLTELESFTSLTQIRGQLAMFALAENFNRATALQALECVGSLFFRTTEVVATPPRAATLGPCE